MVQSVPRRNKQSWLSILLPCGGRRKKIPGQKKTQSDRSSWPGHELAKKKRNLKSTAKSVAKKILIGKRRGNGKERHQLRGRGEEKSDTVPRPQKSQVGSPPGQRRKGERMRLIGEKRKGGQQKTKKKNSAFGYGPCLSP